MSRPETAGPPTGEGPRAFAAGLGRVTNPESTRCEGLVLGVAGGSWRMRALWSRFDRTGTHRETRMEGRAERERTGRGCAGLDDTRLGIPARSEYLRSVRLLAADTAVRAGLDCEEVDDFRIAVDELAHALMAATDHDLYLSFRAGEQRAAAWGSAPGRGGRAAPALSRLSAVIVAGVSDDFEFGADRTEVWFSVVKSGAMVPASPT